MEIIYNAASAVLCQSWAQANGFWDAANGRIIQAGQINGGGEWFVTSPDLFYVGGVAQAGVWGRLRHNGDDLPALNALMASASAEGITLYTYSLALGGWSSDGTTLAPAWVADVGVIA